MRFLVAACLLLSGGWVHAGVVTSLDDVTFWAGSGSNRAAVVIDWNGDSSSDSSLVWGYQWDGIATGADMLMAVIKADPRLFAKIQGYGGGLGFALYGLGYDNGDGQFATSEATSFDSDGIADANPNDANVAVTSGDLYAEGWFKGFWHYGVFNLDNSIPSNSTPYSGGEWSSSNWGMSSRTLDDGSWDSWAFTPTFNFNAYAETPTNAGAAAAVPEPATLTMCGIFGLTAVGASWLRRRKITNV